MYHNTSDELPRWDPPTKQPSQPVLLVEDEVLIQMLAGDYLSDLGYKVEAATNAADALEIARSLHGELAFAVIDIGLPAVGGDVLARELRTLYPRLPIIIASGASVDLRALFGNTTGIAGISKPYLREDIARAAYRLTSPPG